MKLLDYIMGKRKGKEAQRIERDAMSDAFLNDALEGFDSVEGNHAQIVDDLRTRIMQRAAQRRRNHNRTIKIFGIAASVNAIITWSAAACTVVAVSGGLLYLSGSGSDKIKISEQAENGFLAHSRKAKSVIIEEEIIPTAIEAPQPNFEIVEPISVESERMKIMEAQTELSEIVNFEDDKQYDANAIHSISKPKLDKEEEVDEEIPFIIVEQRPQFMNKGADAFKVWVEKNLVYPDNEADVFGQVVVSFIVDIDGSVKDVELVKKLSPKFDAEVVRVVSSSPQWMPAMQMHKPVAVEFTLPVVFK